MRRTVHLLGVGVVILSLAYVGRTLIGHAGEVAALEWSPGAIATILVGTMVYAVALIALAASWMLIALAAPPDRRRLVIALRVYARSGIAKYLPGNVFHLVGRQVLGRALQVSQQRLAVASGAEIVLSLLSVGLVAATFAALPAPLSRGLGLLALAGGAAVVIILACPNVLRRTLPWTAPVLERLIGDAGSGLIGAAVVLNLGFFLGLAAIAGSVLRALTGDAPPVMAGGAVYLSAWLAGYVVPGASGGLGVREAALVAQLDGVVGAPAALAFALAMRLQNVLGDLLLFGASYALPHYPAEEAGP